MNYLTNLNLNRNELQNAVIHKVAVLPTEAVTGQIIFLTTDEKLYVYRTDGWQRLDSVPEVDGLTISLTTDGKLTIAGVQAAIEANPEGIAGLQPVLTADGSITWVKPDTTTVEGLSTAIQALETSVSNMQGEVDNLGTGLLAVQEDVGNDGTDGNAKTGIFAQIDSLNNSVNTNTEDISGLKEQVNGFQQNVQGDFTQADETAPDYIKNKPTKLSQFENDLGFIDSTVENLVNFYTKTEVDTAIANIPKISMEFVDALPEEGMVKNVIYMVPKTTTDGNNAYDEYIWTEQGYELIGNTLVSLDGYATEEYVSQQVQAINTELQTIKDDVAGVKETISGVDERVTSLESKLHPVLVPVATITAGQTSVQVTGIENVISMYATDSDGEQVIIDWLREGANHTFSIDQVYDKDIQITLVYLA